MFACRFVCVSLSTSVPLHTAQVCSGAIVIRRYRPPLLPVSYLVFEVCKAFHTPCVCVGVWEALSRWNADTHTQRDGGGAREGERKEITREQEESEVYENTCSISKT